MCCSENSFARSCLLAAGQYNSINVPYITIVSPTTKHKSITADRILHQIYIAKMVKRDDSKYVSDYSPLLTLHGLRQTALVPCARQSGRSDFATCGRRRLLWCRGGGAEVRRRRRRRTGRRGGSTSGGLQGAAASATQVRCDLPAGERYGAAPDILLKPGKMRRDIVVYINIGIKWGLHRKCAE